MPYGRKEALLRESKSERSHHENTVPVRTIYVVNWKIEQAGKDNAIWGLA